MAQDRHRPGAQDPRPDPAGGASPLASITNEEIGALVSPLGATPDASPAPVLVVSSLLEEKDRLLQELRRLGVPAVVARTCHLALDLLRASRFRAFVAAMADLPANYGPYVARLQSEAPGLPAYLIRDPDERVLPVPATVVTRPLSGPTLEGLLAALVPEAAPASRAAARTAPRSARAVPGATAPESSPTAGPQGGHCDALPAVRAALEAVATGQEASEGLRRWAETDPSVLGTVGLHEEDGASNLRASGGDPGKRHEMVLMLLRMLEEDSPESNRPRALGPFSLFPAPPGGAGTLAILHRDEGTGQAFAEQMSTILSLVDRLRSPASEGPANSRERFVALLESRMKAAARSGGRLGVLLLEGSEHDEPAGLATALRGILRGADWVESVGDHLVYAILDQPKQEVFTVLGERLRTLPGVDQLQVVALGWTPRDGDAEALVQRGERILRTGGRGKSLPELQM